MTIRMTRREFAIATGAAVLAPPALAQSDALLTRAIPSSGERLPAVGLGTAQVFNTNDEATRQKAAAVLQALIAGDGRLVDTSSVYGDAEAVLGDVIAAGGLRGKLFIATKLEAPDAAELKRSLARLKTEKLDLLQFHNVQRSAAIAGAVQGVEGARRRPLYRHHLDPARRLCRDRSGARRGKNRISCRSTIRSTTARPRSASCRSPPRSRPAC